MRCRYCGKELALFKRLTGGGEFCSEAHKQSYQDEYNRLALSRLLQAQKGSHAESAAKKTAAPPAAPVAVEEPAVEEAVVREPALEEQPEITPAVEAESVESDGLPELIAEEEAVPEPIEETEPEPAEVAEFVLETPLPAGLADETPYVESWLEISAGPAVAGWQFENGHSTLSTAALVPLELALTASGAGDSAGGPVAQGNWSPQEFTQGPDRPALPWKGVAGVHQLPVGIRVTPEVSAKAMDLDMDRSTVRELEFETAIALEDSPLLDLPPTAIEFLPEDALVTLAVRQRQTVDRDSGPGEVDLAAAEEGPRASLEALARLHQDLIEQDLAEEDGVQPENLAEPAGSEPPEIVPVATAVEVVAPLPAEPFPVEPAATEAPPLEESSGERSPGFATELLDVAIRMFPPAKPVPVSGAGLPSQGEPLLPRLKSLPLRPKMGLASGYVPPSGAVSPQKTAAAAPKGAPAQTVAKVAVPHSAVKGASTAPSKPATPVKPSSRIAQPAKPAPKVQPAASTIPSKAAPPPAASESHVPKTEGHEPAPKPAPAKEPAPKPAIAHAAAQPSKPVPEEPVKADAKPVPAAPTGEPPAESVPSFGAMQLPASFAGSLKLKLGIAIVILAVACSTWLGWGGKSRRPATSNSTISADGAGPSIIMGEGGWVEGWGGDPSGMHAGRQITIYRPSLQLSDYRIEFQGIIDTQSIGWVFRAADPQNYYAMKLMVIPGLKSKVTLFKYLVINGRQTQVGRVPVDVSVEPDTVFHIRTDVRGPQFTTYIQGKEADVWTDDQLKTGGVGFLNERDERSKVTSVSIRYLNGAAK